MSAVFKKLQSNGLVEAPKAEHIQRLDAVKALNSKIQKQAEDLQKQGEELKAMSESNKVLRERLEKMANDVVELKQGFEALCVDMDRNHNEMIENIESYLVSDDFTPRNKTNEFQDVINELTNKLDVLDKKVKSIVNPVIHARSQSVSRDQVREASDTENVKGLSKLNLKHRN